MDLNKVISQGFKKLISEYKKKRFVIASDLKLDIHKLNNYLDGKAKWDLSYAHSVANYFNRSVDELVGFPKVNTTKDENKLVPQLGFADCGKPSATWYDPENNYKFVDVGDVKGLTNPFVLIARGESMKPYINSGDKLLSAEMEISRIKNQSAVIAVYSGMPDSTEANAKLILKKKDYVTFYSINTKYPPEDIPYEDIIKIYKLVRIVRDVK